MSEIVISDDVNDVSLEHKISIDSVIARKPLSDTRCDTDLLNAESIADLGPRNQDPCSTDARGVTTEHPQGEGGCKRASLNVDNDIIGKVSAAMIN